MTGRESVFPLAELREFAAALDNDRGHDKSRVTRLMREAADEIERLQAALAEIATYVDSPGRPVLALMAKEALRG
jgi:hypothetical protein